MARFTVADCMETIPNRYEMTLAAATRARQLAHGEEQLISDENGDKPNVIALREIAKGSVTNKILETLE